MTIIPMPRGIKIYNASTEPCDTAVGPCCCGAWHDLSDMPEEVRKALACAACGQPATPDDGLCTECAEKLDKLACSFEGREG